MTEKKGKGANRELIRAYRYEMTLEAVQLILTDDAWFKADLAEFLQIDYDQLNKLLTRRHYPVDARLMRQVKRLYQRKYGHRRWYYIAQYIKRFRLSLLNKRNKHDDYDR